MHGALKLLCLFNFAQCLKKMIEQNRTTTTSPPVTTTRKRIRFSQFTIELCVLFPRCSSKEEAHFWNLYGRMMTIWLDQRLDVLFLTLLHKHNFYTQIIDKYQIQMTIELLNPISLLYFIFFFPLLWNINFNVQYENFYHP